MNDELIMTVFFICSYLNKSVFLIGKILCSRPEEVNEKGEELKREEQENETGSQVSC